MIGMQVLEGKWEEIKLHEAELAGKEVRVIIFPTEETTKQEKSAGDGTSLAEMLKGRTGLISIEPSDLSEDTGRKFADLLNEKYQADQQ